MPLFTDPTSPTYNSHFDEAEFDAEIESMAWKRDITGWTGLTAAQKEDAILESVENTKRKKWDGAPSAIIANDQMIWPRSGLTYPSGAPVDDTTNPQELLSYEACYILGVLDSRGGTGAITTGEVKSRTVGKLKEDYTTSADATTTQSSVDTSCDRYVSGWIQAGAVGGVQCALLTRR